MSQTFDPDRSLRTLLALVSDEGIREIGVDRSLDLVRHVVEALDEHLSTGGPLPHRWMTKPERAAVAAARLNDRIRGTNFARGWRPQIT
jgi:hypothetical protein